MRGCQGLGEACSRTIFQRCCNDAVCDLKWFGHGTCVKCYEPRRLCLRDVECCSNLSERRRGLQQNHFPEMLRPVGLSIRIVRQWKVREVSANEVDLLVRKLAKPRENSAVRQFFIDVVANLSVIWTGLAVENALNISRKETFASTIASAAASGDHGYPVDRTHEVSY
ncbi:unnamed protein product [Schistocephalus solidus]|uniref:UPF0506 domain-containing protein n=1 Tax=Schistocephalus solidus TaxID=70667 RepID=A0A183SLA5_SCHSO|nr:unnamed protein product [Schistocephalus solidus]